MTNLDAWIAGTSETGILDWPALRAAVEADLRAALTQQSHALSQKTRALARLVIVVQKVRGSCLPPTREQGQCEECDALDAALEAATREALDTK